MGYERLAWLNVIVRRCWRGVKAATDAAVPHATLGVAKAVHVIPRPHTDVEKILPKEYQLNEQQQPQEQIMAQVISSRGNAGTTGHPSVNPTHTSITVAEKPRFNGICRPPLAIPIPAFQRRYPAGRDETLRSAITIGTWRLAPAQARTLWRRTKR